MPNNKRDLTLFPFYIYIYIIHYFELLEIFFISIPRYEKYSQKTLILTLDYENIPYYGLWLFHVHTLWATQPSLKLGPGPPDQAIP